MIKDTLLSESCEILLIVNEIIEYIEKKNNEKKDLISLKIDKLIIAINTLMNLKKFSNCKEIEKSLNSIRKVIVDLDAFKKKSHTKKSTYSVMYMNADRELISYSIEGKNQNIKFDIRYTARPDKYNKLIENYFALEKKDVLSLLYNILVKKFGSKYSIKEIEDFIINKFNFKSFKKTEINKLKFVAITIKGSTLNIPMNILKEEEEYNRESENNLMYRTYSIYFDPHNRQSNVYKNLSKDDIKNLFNHPFNNVNYLE